MKITTSNLTLCRFMVRPRWITCCLVLLFGCATIQINPNIATQFHGIPWGENREKIEDLQVTPNEFSSGKSRFFKGYREKDVMRFADTDVNKIEYHFKDDRFYMVYMTGRGYSNYTHMLNFLLNHYGEPRMNKKELETYIWIVSDVAIQTRYYAMNSRFIVHVYYLPLK